MHPACFVFLFSCALRGAQFMLVGHSTFSRSTRQIPALRQSSCFGRFSFLGSCLYATTGCASTGAVDGPCESHSGATLLSMPLFMKAVEARSSVLLLVGVYGREPLWSGIIGRDLCAEAVSVLKGHEYDSFTPLEASVSVPGLSTIRLAASQSASSHSSVSDQVRNDPKPSGKRKQKSRTIEEDNQTQPTLSFDPESIIHPRSTEWVLCIEVAHYVQDKLCKRFYQDVCSTLRFECPHPSLLAKVVDKPESDLNLVTFIKKFTKDPKKDLDRAWKGCQDKLLDISGPIMKILELAVQVEESSAPLNLDTILEWAQRAICLLGNDNCAMSTERRRSFLRAPGREYYQEAIPKEVEEVPMPYLDSTTPDLEDVVATASEPVTEVGFPSSNGTTAEMQRIKFFLTELTGHLYDFNQATTCM
ncbi:hypothetical protein NDU88_001094 [Pleurodeles waltl]|uniref:Uncharacterized protein n=1 Tax=Pleurodeles waltl TaxID=8319 RepID=A0AAV7U7G1_PLEWA|nr:hypothetical protein NDU88_001094 [Pleurodeles waltl]